MSAKLKEIIIKTKKRLFGANLGNNVSIFHGNGLDFSEIKEYNYGDDVKKINHKVTAKEQKPYVNVFNEERELNIVVAFMVSGSIYFGSQVQKQEIMAEIMALIGYSAIKNSDRFSAIFFDNKEIKAFKPTKSANTLYSAIEYALSIDPLGKEANYKELSQYLLDTIKQKSIIFIIGDFYEEVDIEYLAAKHELYLINVRDPFEENPKFNSEVSLIDPTTLKSEQLNVNKATINSFKKMLQKQEQNLKLRAIKSGAKYTKVYTNEDIYIKLLALFGGRA
jgi:uncharacterized protein (DUF58 family)